MRMLLRGAVALVILLAAYWAWALAGAAQLASAASGLRATGWSGSPVFAEKMSRVRELELATGRCAFSGWRASEPARRSAISMSRVMCELCAAAPPPGQTFAPGLRGK
jgi:hypothetical protein